MLKYLHEINLHLNPFWRYHLQSSNIQIKYPGSVHLISASSGENVLECSSEHFTENMQIKHTEVF